jgi:outer membrane lipoprotein-sorting protein
MMIRFVLFALAAGLACAESLETVLAHMDAAAKTSNSFAATVKWQEFTKVLSSTDEQTGALKLKKNKGRVVGRLDIEKPNAFTWHFSGDTWEKYLPKANILSVYQVAKLAKSTDQYLLLVFGLTGAELKKAYDLKPGPEETVNGIKATRLELLPKDKEARKLVAKVELWIPVGQTYAIQQKVTEPNGDFNLWIYGDAKLNPGLPDSAFDFVAPPNVKREVFKK